MHIRTCALRFFMFLYVLVRRTRIHHLLLSGYDLFGGRIPSKEATTAAMRFSLLYAQPIPFFVWWKLNSLIHAAADAHQTSSVSFMSTFWGSAFYVFGLSLEVWRGFPFWTAYYLLFQDISPCIVLSDSLLRFDLTVYQASKGFDPLVCCYR